MLSKIVQKTVISQSGTVGDLRLKGPDPFKGGGQREVRGAACLARLAG